MLALGAAFASAIFWVLVLLISGAGLLAAGIYLLYGLPWALLSGAGCSFVFSFLLLLGLSRGR